MLFFPSTKEFTCLFTSFSRVHLCGLLKRKIHSFIHSSSPPQAKVKEFPKENIFFPFTKFFLPIYFFLALVFVVSWKERDSFIATPPPKQKNSLKKLFFSFTNSLFTYLLLFWGWSLCFLGKRDPFIHSFIATQQRKKKSKRKENVLIGFKKGQKNNQLYVLSNLVTYLNIV